MGKESELCSRTRGERVSTYAHICDWTLLIQRRLHGVGRLWQLLGVNCSSLSVRCCRESTAEVAQALDNCHVGLLVSPVAQNIGRQKTVNEVNRVESLHRTTVGGELREARASTSS